MTKAQLLAAAAAIDAYTDAVGEKTTEEDPACASSPAFVAAIMVCTAIHVALLAMAHTAPEEQA